MDYIDLLKKIDNRKLKNINLIHVKEPYLYDLVEKSLEEDYIGEDFLEFNFDRVDFEKISSQEFIAKVETLPIMSDKKLVLMENMRLERESVKKYEGILDTIAKQMDDFNPDTILVMVYDGDKLFKGKFYKKVAQHGDIININRLNRGQMMGFIKKYFQRNDKLIDNRSASFIESKLGYLSRDSKINLYDVENELSKIVNNISKKSPSLQDIEESIIENYDENIFRLLDLMSERKLKESLRQLSVMKSQDQYMIFHMILRQVRNLICVKSCKQQKFNKKTTMGHCSIGSFEHDKLSGFIRNFSSEKLLEIHHLIFEMETKLKTSSMDIEDIVERIVIEFCS